MIWLILSIVFSACLFLIFTHIGKLKIHVLPVIVINYLTCFVIGNLIPGHAHVFQVEYLHEPWFFPVLGMGFLFIAGFYSMGSATAAAGAAPASVASKMSVVVPALVAILWLNETPGFWQILGIVFSLLAVFLMTEAAPDGKRLHKGLWLLVAVFLSSGAVDTGLNLITHFYSETSDPYTVSTLIFGSAGLLGMTLFLWNRKRATEAEKDLFIMGKREWMLGVILGTVNYASLITILSGIEYFHGKTAWFFAINNIAVVAVSSIAAALIFGERIHRSGYWGLALTGLAIVLMNFDAIFR